MQRGLAFGLDPLYHSGGEKAREEQIVEAVEIAEPVDFVASDFHSDRRPTMSSPIVLRKLRAYGEKHLAMNDAREVLYALYIKQGKSLGEIADLLRVTRPGIAYQVKALNLPIQPPGRRAVLGIHARRLGYVDLASYFSKNASRSFESMADELKVTPETVRRHYDLFVRDVQAAS